jgi:two-component system response regulator AlgR
MARRHFAVHERGRLMLVPVDQAIYLKAELKYVTVRTRQREYLIEDSLTALEAEFGDRFVRVHRNALVCRACVAGFERVPPDERSPGADPHWQVVLRDVPERLAVSRRQWSTVRNLMG